MDETIKTHSDTRTITTTTRSNQTTMILTTTVVSHISSPMVTTVDTHNSSTNLSKRLEIRRIARQAPRLTILRKADMTLIWSGGSKEEDQVVVLNLRDVEGRTSKML